VSDVRATAQQCASITFNPMFGEFETVRDYCYLFLNNSVSFTYKNELKLFAFLLPMESVFEDFIFGFIDKEMEKVKAKAQISSTYLDVGRNFALRPDLLLEIQDKPFLADTKYKIIYADQQDPKRGISQSDLYQMLAYAVRFKIEEILLFYPNTIKSYEEQVHEIIIEDKFAPHQSVRVRVCQLPVVAPEMFDQEVDPSWDIKQIFEPTREELAARILAIMEGENQRK
jgi:5-methylcytosine-specific restriction enzyme subunit McrC